MANKTLKKITWSETPIQVESAIRDGSGHIISSYYQPLNAKLTSFSGLGSDTGLVKISNGTVSILNESTFLSNIPKATTSALGGVKLYSSTVNSVTPNSVSSTASRTYAVQLNSSDQMVVNVPWEKGTGTVTSVSAGTGLSISGTASTTPTVNIASGYKLPTTSEWNALPTSNTTYTIAEGTENGKIKITPSSGTAYEISVHGLGAAAYKGVATSVSSTSTDSNLATAKAVYDAINALPDPMVFKGSLGTGGTITSLPAAAASNNGHTYKVITAGTYQSITCKVGDTLISNGTAWTLIPSGDEPSGTVTSVAGAGASGSHISVTGGPVTSSGTLTVGVESGYSIPSTTKQSEWDAKQNALSSLSESSGGTAVSLVTTGEKYSWNHKSTLALVSSGGTNGSATTAARSDHTHTTSLTADTGTSSITLSHGSKYKLTAGGTSVIFTLPSDNNTNYYHSTGSWSGTTYTASNNGGSSCPAFAFTLPDATTSAKGVLAMSKDNLNTMINQLDTGSSNAQRDDYYISQYAGGGTTTTTYHRRKVSNLFAALNSSDITTALGFTPYNSTNPNGYTSNTGTVIGSSLTSGNFVLGNGGVNVTASTLKPTTSSTSWNATSDVNVPTMKAISNYVSSLGFIDGSLVPTNQANTIIVQDATHNISGKNLSNYSAVETTISSYPVIIIKTSGSATLTEAQAKTYMAAQTGSSFLPKYDYDNPTYTYLIFGNGKLYKVQYDSTNGLVLYYMNQLAYNSQIPTVNNGTLTIKINGNQEGTFTANASSGTTIDITAAKLGLSSAMKFLGTSSTVITDGSTTGTITVSGSSVTAAAGNVVLYGSKEFVWTGSAWEELGNEGSYALSSVKVEGTTGLTGGGDLTTNRTIKPNLNSETSLGTIGTTSKLYAVGIDSNNKLCVNVPWSDTNTATAADNILHGTNSGTQITYAPYTSKSAGKLYTGTTTPSSSDRLNYDGYFYATKFYDANGEVVSQVKVIDLR